MLIRSRLPTRLGQNPPTSNFGPEPVDRTPDEPIY
jgi:hypothetical protein